MARKWVETAITEDSKFKRASDGAEVSKLIGSVKVALEDAGIMLRVSTSPSIDWHRESSDVENGASVILTKEQSANIRRLLEKAEAEL